MAKKLSNIKTAMIYAEAMYGSAQQANVTDIMYADACCLQNVLCQNLDLLRQIDNHLWDINAKTKIIEAVANKFNLCAEMQNTLKVLTENRKIKLLSVVLEQFKVLYQKKHDIAEVEVTTVMELSPKQEELLKEKLAAIFNKKIILKYIIDTGIIGGLVLKYGTNLIDNSIKHKLNVLEQMMKGNK